MDKNKLIEMLNKHKPCDQKEINDIQKAIRFLNENDVYLGKGNVDGHVTVDIWIVDRERGKVLLTHHRKLNLWIQLGGHIDVGEDIRDAAIREAAEESGLSLVRLLSEDIFDLDVHEIPEHKNEKAHIHYAIMLLAEADSSEKIVVSNESKDVKWVDLDKITDYIDADDKRRRRAVEKTFKFFPRK